MDDRTLTLIVVPHGDLETRSFVVTYRRLGIVMGIILAVCVAVALMFQRLFQVAPQEGLVNSLLNTVGIGSVDWLGNGTTAFLVIILMDLWRSAGFYAVLLFTGLLDDRTGRELKTPDPVEVSFLFAADAGVFVATSAWAVNTRFKRDVTRIAYTHDARSLRFLAEKEAEGTSRRRLPSIARSPHGDHA